MTKRLSEVRQVTDPRLIWINDKDMSPKDNMRASGHSDVVWWVRSGGITVRTDHDEWKIRPGDWAFLRPVQRQQIFLPGTRMISICYRWRQTSGSPHRVGSEVVIMRRCSELEQSTHHLINQVEQSGSTQPIGRVFDFPCSPENWLRINAHFMQWMATLLATLSAHGVSLTPHDQVDDRVYRVRSLIERDPWNPSTDLKHLAESVGISRRRLEQLFTTAFGRGIAQTRSRLRVEQAQTLLDHRDMPLKAVAKRFGFSTSPAFSTWFRRHAGISPRAYRNGQHMEA